MIAEHLSTNNEHYTPSEIALAARAVLGRVDLDPASCAAANTIVQASRFFSKDEDGLARTWSGRVFLNPPGGRVGCISEPKKWWRKLADDYAAGRVTAAVFLGFNIQILQTSQVGCTGEMVLPMHFPMCVPARRLKFVHDHGGKLVAGGSPAHASVIVFLPPKDVSDARHAFAKVFSPIGAVFGGGL
jgi:ParB family transcriptional regulator, chromosome partitioning protein